MATVKLIAGQPNKVEFKFYDEVGNVVTSFNSAPQATLYNTLDNSEVDTGLSLNFNGVNNNFYLIYTPSSDLSGTFYFVASGIDTSGVLRKSIVFVDILPIGESDLVISIDFAVKFIDDINIDYSIVPQLILTAKEWIKNKIGGALLPEQKQERIYLFEDNKFYTSFYPILKVNSLKDSNDNDISNYTILDKNIGLFEIGKNSFKNLINDSNNYIVIDYITGFNPIPDTIYTAIGLLVGYLYKETKYQNYDRIKMVGVDSILSKDNLSRIESLLRPYIRVL